MIQEDWLVREIAWMFWRAPSEEVPSVSLSFALARLPLSCHRATGFENCRQDIVLGLEKGLGE